MKIQFPGVLGNEGVELMKQIEKHSSTIILFHQFKKPKENSRYLKAEKLRKKMILCERKSQFDWKMLEWKIFWMFLQSCFNQFPYRDTIMSSPTTTSAFFWSSLKIWTYKNCHDIFIFYIFHFHENSKSIRHLSLKIRKATNFPCEKLQTTHISFHSWWLYFFLSIS